MAQYQAKEHNDTHAQDQRHAKDPEQHQGREPNLQHDQSLSQHVGYSGEDFTKEGDAEEDVAASLKHINSALDIMSLPGERVSTPVVNIIKQLRSPRPSVTQGHSQSSPQFHIDAGLTIITSRELPMIPKELRLWGPNCSTVDNLLQQAFDVGIFRTQVRFMEEDGNTSLRLGFLKLESAPATDDFFATSSDMIYEEWYQHNSALDPGWLKEHLRRKQAQEFGIPVIRVHIYLCSVENNMLSQYTAPFASLAGGRTPDQNEVQTPQQQPAAASAGRGASLSSGTSRTGNIESTEAQFPTPKFTFRPPPLRSSASALNPSPPSLLDTLRNTTRVAATINPPPFPGARPVTAWLPPARGPVPRNPNFGAQSSTDHFAPRSDYFTLPTEVSYTAAPATGPELYVPHVYKEETVNVHKFACQNITAQAAYQRFSNEELRLSDYENGRCHGAGKTKEIQSSGEPVQSTESRSNLDFKAAWGIQPPPHAIPPSTDTSTTMTTITKTGPNLSAADERSTWQPVPAPVSAPNPELELGSNSNSDFNFNSLIGPSTNVTDATVRPKVRAKSAYFARRRKREVKAEDDSDEDEDEGGHGRID